MFVTLLIYRKIKLKLKLKLFAYLSYTKNINKNLINFNDLMSALLEDFTL